MIVGVEAEQVEALDLILAATDAGKVPVPENLGAASNEDLNCVDASHGRSIQDTVDVDLLACERNTAELRRVSVGTRSGRWFNSLVGLRGRGSSQKSLDSHRREPLVL